MTNHSTQHYYSPQNCIVNVINAEILGLYDLSVLPSYYQPTDEAIAFARKLADRALDGTDVTFVLSDEVPEGWASMTQAEKVTGRLSFIIGPSDLEQTLGGRDGSSSWLWDKGEASAVLKNMWITHEASN